MTHAAAIITGDLYGSKKCAMFDCGGGLVVGD